jgi:hypothetical protein
MKFIYFFDFVRMYRKVYKGRQHSIKGMKRSGTWHILKQVEWYNKLREKYGCSFVEMEYQEKITGISRKRREFWKPLALVYDVYGRTSDGKTFVIEVGRIAKWKLEYLQNRKDIVFIHEKFPSSPILWVK